MRRCIREELRLVRAPEEYTAILAGEGLDLIAVEGSWSPFSGRRRLYGIGCVPASRTEALQESG